MAGVSGQIISGYPIIKSKTKVRSKKNVLRVKKTKNFAS